MNQVRPAQAVTTASPNPIQPSRRACTRENPSQNARPMIPKAGWVNSSSARAPGMTGAFLPATSEGGSNCSRRARFASRCEAGGGGEAGWVRGAVGGGGGGEGGGGWWGGVGRGGGGWEPRRELAGRGARGGRA